MSYVRRLSPVERAWLVATELYPPFVNQLVIEGSGVLGLDPLQAAADTATSVNPGARVVLRGALCRARWVAGGPGPAVRAVDGTGWDGLGPEGAPFLLDRLDPSTGPSVEVLVAAGSPSRIVLRTLHATMDGGGTLAFADDLFRALRGELPLGHPDTVTDLQVANTVSSGRFALPPHDALPPMGAPEGPIGKVSWRRVHLDQTPRALLARLALALARQARSHREGVVRFEIPADLRRNQPGLRSTANLTGVLRLVVPPDATVAQLVHDLRSQQAAGVHAGGVRGFAWLRHVPLSWMRAGSRRGAAEHLATGLYGTSGVLSNMGRLDLSRWRAAGFHASGCFFVPPATEVTSLFVALSGHATGVDVVLAAPRHLCTNGRLDDLAEIVRAALAASP